MPNQNHNFVHHADEYTQDGHLYRDDNSHQFQRAFSSPFNGYNKHYIVARPVSMWQAFTLFWKNYTNFKGYSGRAEYWWWFLWSALITMILWLTIIPAEIMNLVATLYAGGNLNDTGIDFTNGPFGLITSLSNFSIFGLLLIIWILIKLIPTLSLKTRRFRDAGVPIGWIIVLLVTDFIPLLNGFSHIIELVIACLPSVRQS